MVKAGDEGQRLPCASRRRGVRARPSLSCFFARRVRCFVLFLYSGVGGESVEPCSSSGGCCCGCCWSRAALHRGVETNKQTDSAFWQKERRDEGPLRNRTESQSRARVCASLPSNGTLTRGKARDGGDLISSDMASGVAAPLSPKSPHCHALSMLPCPPMPSPMLSRPCPHTTRGACLDP